MLQKPLDIADMHVDEEALLDLAVEIGYQLSINGAETYRIEDSMRRIPKAYGFETQAYAIPTYMHISIRAQDGKVLSRMRRIGDHGTDMDGIERYSRLCRKICENKPSMQEARIWMEETEKARVSYGALIFYLAHFFAGAGFSMLFGGSVWDTLCGGLCALLSGVAERGLSILQVNRFFRTAIAGFIMAFPAYIMSRCGIIQNPDMAIMGAIMPLIPGLLFTNAMRDIFYGDSVSSLNRMLQVLLLATAIAIGAAVAFYFSMDAGQLAEVFPVNQYSWFIRSASCFIACLGFAVLFNVHGSEVLWGAAGGLIVWIVYAVLFERGHSELISYFWASCVSGLFAESMARIKKTPPCAYLVVSLVPLIPGSGLYRTMRHAVNGNAQAFLASGANTILLAVMMCIGIIVVNSIFRLYRVLRTGSYRHAG